MNEPTVLLQTAHVAHVCVPRRHSLVSVHVSCMALMSQSRDSERDTKYESDSATHVL